MQRVHVVERLNKTLTLPIKTTISKAPYLTGTHPFASLGAIPTPPYSETLVPFADELPVTPKGTDLRSRSNCTATSVQLCAYTQSPSFIRETSNTHHTQSETISNTLQHPPQCLTRRNAARETSPDGLGTPLPPLHIGDIFFHRWPRRLLRTIPLCALSLFSALFAAADNTVDRVKNLNLDIVASITSQKHSFSRSAHTNDTQLLEMLKERRRLLQDLLNTTPERVHDLTFSRDILLTLANSYPETTPYLEEYGEWNGTTQQYVEDDFELGTSREVLDFYTQSGHLTLHLQTKHSATHIGHRTLTINGLKISHHLLAITVTPTEGLDLPAQCSTIDEQRIVALLVETPNYKLPSHISHDFLRGILFGNTYATTPTTPDYSVDDYLQRASMGNIRLSYPNFEIVGPYTLQRNYDRDPNGNPSCDYNSLINDALAAADSTVTFTNGTRVLIVMPAVPNCSWGGRASIGCWNGYVQDGGFEGSIILLRGDQVLNRQLGVALIAHEFGHNLGMLHASTREFVVDGTKLPLGPPNSAGTLNEYGDKFSSMGFWNLGYYSSQHAAKILKWLKPERDFIQVESQAQFVLAPYEQETPGLKALRVRRGSNSDAWLWLEYRTNKGIYGATLPYYATHGALVHYEDASTYKRTHLLDFAPSNGWSDVVLPAHSTWKDPYSNLVIKVLNKTQEGLEVEVRYDCETVFPDVSVSPTTLDASPGQAMTFSITVANHDSSSCSEDVLGVSASPPSGWVVELSSSTLILSPGSHRTVTATVTVPTGFPSGTYDVNVFVSRYGAPPATRIVRVNVGSTQLPDLRVQKVLSARTGVLGQTIVVSVSVRNVGYGDATPFRVGVYWVGDGVTSTLNLFSGSYCTFSFGLTAQSESLCEMSVRVPQEISQGYYMIRAVVDDEYSVLEIDEQNNGRDVDNGPIRLIDAGTPVPVSVNPSSGVGIRQEYKVSFQVVNGWSDIEVVNVLINSALDGRAACYIAYIPASNTLMLVDDEGNAGGPYRVLALPSQGSVGNGQCIVHGERSYREEQNTVIAFTVDVEFMEGFEGSKVIYGAAQGKGARNSDWRRLGVWYVSRTGNSTVTYPGILEAGRVSLVGTGPQSLTLSVADMQDWRNLDVVNVLISNWLDGRYSCYIAYSVTTGVVYLVNDEGDRLLPGLRLGQPGTISNSQCTVFSESSSVTADGNVLSFGLSLGLSPTFQNKHVVYGAVRDKYGQNSGWLVVGSWSAQ